MNDIDTLRAQLEVLQGVGCEEDGDGPCGVCIKCALAGKHVKSNTKEIDDLKSQIDDNIDMYLEWESQWDYALTSYRDVLTEVQRYINATNGPGKAVLRAKIDKVMREQNHDGKDRYKRKALTKTND